MSLSSESTPAHDHLTAILRDNDAMTVTLENLRDRVAALNYDQRLAVGRAAPLLWEALLRIEGE